MNDMSIRRGAPEASDDDDPLDDFARHSVSLLDETKTVLVSGQGPA